MRPPRQVRRHEVVIPPLHRQGDDHLGELGAHPRTFGIARTVPFTSDMPDRRPFPPSPRRRALARQAGLTGASPLLVSAAAIGAAAAASAMLARAAAATIGAWIAAACDVRPTLAPAGLVHAVMELAAPLLGIAAIAAIAVHLAQTRGVWLPRRRIEGAPALPAGAGARTRAAAFELLAAAVVGVTAFGWLWLTAPRLALLVDGSAGVAAASAQAGLAIAAFLATIAIAWVALGALDALLRHAAMGSALAMTAEEKREDDRLAAADPRWRARRAELARSDARSDARGASAREAIAASTVLLLGDDVAVAITWDPVRRPTPTRIAAGTGALATQLLAHARRQALPVHRDAALAKALTADFASLERAARSRATADRRGPLATPRGDCRRRARPVVSASQRRRRPQYPHPRPRTRQYIVMTTSPGPTLSVRPRPGGRPRAPARDARPRDNRPSRRSTT